MNWVYIKHDKNDIDNYVKYLMDNGYSCSRYGDYNSQFSTVVIYKQVFPAKTELPFRVGDIIYFMSIYELRAFKFAGIKYQRVPKIMSSRSDTRVTTAVRTTVTPKVKEVIFNDPATIVFWSDNTKTVVKCQAGEKFDKEKGLALCYMKKTLGNTGNYYTTMKNLIENARSGKNE